MSLTFAQADKILKIMNEANASYPLTLSEVKRLRPLIYLACIFGIIDGLQYNWYLHGPYNKSVNDFLMHLVDFTREHRLEDWYGEIE